MVIQLNEHYVTLWNEPEYIDEKEKYLDEVWNLIQTAYASIGGMASMTHKEDLMDDNLMWKLVVRNGKVVCCSISKIVGNTRKMVGGCSDGTPQGKKDFYAMCAEDVTQTKRNAWAEVSGSMEGVYLFKLNAIPIPVDIAEKILNDRGKTILRKDKDGFHYVRKIGGKLFEKIMFGNVPEQYRTDWENESEQYRKDFKDYVSKHPEEVERRKKQH